MSVRGMAGTGPRQKDLFSRSYALLPPALLLVPRLCSQRRKSEATTPAIKFPETSVGPPQTDEAIMVERSLIPATAAVASAFAWSC